MEPDVLVGTGIEQYPCYIASELMINEKKHYYKRVVEKKDNRTKFSGSNPMQKMVMEWEKAIKAGDGTDAKFIFPLVLYRAPGGCGRKTEALISTMIFRTGRMPIIDAWIRTVECRFRLIISAI